MSAHNDLDITCGACTEEFQGTVWTAVNAKQDPELKDLLLGGELNLVMCPRCSQVFYHESFLIYHDSKEEVLAYVYPEEQAEQRDDIAGVMMKGFQEAQAGLPAKERLTYPPMAIFGLETLVELLHEEQPLVNQSDVAEAICKEKKIPYMRLSPSEARKKGWPRVLPGQSSGEIDPIKIKKGIQQLLEADPVLDRYKTLSESI